MRLRLPLLLLSGVLSAAGDPPTIPDSSVTLRVEPFLVSRWSLAPGTAVTVDFELNADGTVKDALIRSPQTMDESLERMAMAFQFWRFVPNTPSPGRYVYYAPGRREVTSPRLVDRNEPDYDAEARDKRIQGKAVCYVIIGTDGKVLRAQSLRWVPEAGSGADGDGGLLKKAVESLKSWRFDPATRNGRAVAVAAMVEINFRLN